MKTQSAKLVVCSAGFCVAIAFLPGERAGGGGPASPGVPPVPDATLAAFIDGAIPARFETDEGWAESVRNFRSSTLAALGQLPAEGGLDENRRQMLAEIASFRFGLFVRPNYESYRRHVEHFGGPGAERPQSSPFRGLSENSFVQVTAPFLEAAADPGRVLCEPVLVRGADKSVAHFGFTTTSTDRGAYARRCLNLVNSSGEIQPGLQVDMYQVLFPVEVVVQGDPKRFLYGWGFCWCADQGEWIPRTAIITDPTPKAKPDRLVPWL